MCIFKVELSFFEKDGFNPNLLKDAIVNNLKEVKLRIKKFDYQSKIKDICAEIPSLNKKVSVATIYIEYKETHGLPYQIVLGGISEIKSKYPYFELYSINPSFVEDNS